ncbi:MAG: glycosyltransferase [Calditrichaeota bacterium]|nr:glycosyltransferase [Calditrichota bacterium]
MSKLQAYFNYRKFQAPPFRIIYLNDDYFLQSTSIEALKQLGHQVVPLQIERHPSRMLEKLLKTCVLVKPDAVMGINHGGFDPEGKIASILAELDIPIVMWYLDDFRFIIFKNNVHATPNSIIFTFDKKQVNPLLETGFQHVFYLPSGSSFDPRRSYRDKKFNFLHSAITFVGNTFDKTKTMRDKPHYSKHLQELEHKIDFTLLHHNLVEQIETYQKSHFADEDDFYQYAGFVIAHATQIYRQYMLRQIQEENFHIFGDGKWKELGVRATIHRGTHFLKETPHVYAQSMINLNLSSQQLESTVSLRIFDVPAAGGFLLTDWKESLAELFDVTSEIAYFNSVEEMKEKIAYYRSHPDQRERIVQKARARVEKEHLVRHRIERMLSICQQVLN